MIVLGVDPGLTKENPTGIAVVETDGDGELVHSCTVYAPKKALWTARLSLIVCSLQKIITDFPSIALVTYEYPFIGNNSQSTIKLAHVGGACYALGRPCQMVFPAQAKVALTGDGKANKAAMVKMARNMFGVSVTKDEADAIGIAMAGEAIYRREQYALPV